MGWGDEIIATGQARELQRHDPRAVLIIDRHARPRWSPIWENNPRLARDRSGKFQSLLNGPGVRPYVERKLATRWVWRTNFRCEPGEIYLSEAERAFAAPYRGRVLIEPNVKDKAEAVNKRWAFDRWQALVDMRLADFLQVGPPGTRLLRGVDHAITENFRLACAVLSVCRGFVGHEGGLHHAAAALGVPAVVLFSGYISPAITGYATQRNIHHGGAACGSRLPCLHCKESLEAIGVDEVRENLRALL